MIEYKLFSRNSLGIAAYADIKKRRIAMKKAKDPRQLAFKIVLNGTYGILGSDYYAFGDPLYMYTVCIYGQLLLTDCMCRLYNAG
jgi:DNA polymerase elongation subunit (family B)